MNRDHFGVRIYPSGVVSSYPQMRRLTLIALSTHLERSAVFGEYDKNEMRYAGERLDQIPDHS